MRRTALLVLVLALSSVAGIAAQPARQPIDLQLHLHRGTFDILQGSSTTASQSLAAVSGPYAIVQFRGPITPTDRSGLEQLGVHPLEYLPDFAYLVRADATQLAAATRLPQVYGVAPFTVADKLAPSLLQALANGSSDVGNVRLVGWPDDRGTLAQAARTAAIDTSLPFSATTLLQAAALPSVRWIEPATRPKLLNDKARAIMHVEPAWQNHNLFGQGQIVAVADSGLDTGQLATVSPDFAGRLVATHVLSAGGDLGDNFGHGTHVAGSVGGSGVQSGAKPEQHQYNGSFAGVAPEAGLVIQAFEADAGGAVIGLDPDYYQLFAQAYADGARLHTNSWGDPTGPITSTHVEYGGYPYGSQRTDQFMWDHRDMAIFFAAGNEGADGTPGPLGFCTNGDGVVDQDSLLYPGTAKNVITVGASESERDTGGLSQIPWLLASFCFASPPIATDTLSNNRNGMAAFSSRGPTDDGRVKPDIVAPGTNIVSNKSHYPGASPLWGQYENNADYAYSGGTSMATPLTAGAGALVRQWLSLNGLANPSAAAVKATLLNTAADMAPGQYGTGAQQEIPASRPNNVAGWGRTDLGFIDAPPPYGLWVDDHSAGITTGQMVQYSSNATRSLEVRDSSQPLRALLAWTDPPASLSAAKQLVNDLDLVVTGPGGVMYRGNNVASGDHINNVEGVIIANPPVGQYQVEVRGYNVPIETQPYALAVSGAISTRAPLLLTTNEPLTVTQGATAVISNTLLRATETGRTSGQLVYTVVTTTANGSLQKQSVPLSVGQTFTQDDIDTGRLTYVHNGGTSSDDRFSFTIVDGVGGNINETAFTILVVPSNGGPTISSIPDQSIAANTATRPIPFAIGSASKPVGTLGVTASSSNTTLVPDQNIILLGTGASRTATITPAANQFGTTLITLRVSDGTSTARTSFMLTVTPVTSGLVAVDDRTTTDMGVTVTIPVLENDKDTDGNALTITSLGLASHGVVASDGSSVTYTPSAGWSGSDSFTYTVTNGHGNTATATVTVVVSDQPLTTQIFKIYLPGVTRR